MRYRPKLKTAPDQVADKADARVWAGAVGDTQEQQNGFVGATLQVADAIGVRG